MLNVSNKDTQFYYRENEIKKADIWLKSSALWGRSFTNSKK